MGKGREATVGRRSALRNLLSPEYVRKRSRKLPKGIEGDIPLRKSRNAGAENEREGTKNRKTL